MNYSTYIGIDTHSRKNCVFAPDAETGEFREATLSGDPRDVVEWVLALGARGPVMCVYEAGPTGFGLARALMAAGVGCTVAATSKLAYPRDRNKHDRKDAQWLARQMMAGAVRAVHVPDEERESLCRLSKLRAEAASDLRRAKQRLRSFMLVCGIRYDRTKKLWTKAFARWARSLECACPADTFVFREKLAEVERLSERLARVDAEIGRAVAADERLSGAVARLRCLHGVGPVTAFSLAAETYGFSRFRGGAAYASWLGPAPSESSSGERESRGRITRTGNPNLRRLVIEAAGCYSRGARPSPAAPAGAPEAVAAAARKCAERLRRRRERLSRAGLSPNKAKCAVARELAEWIWHVAVMPALPPRRPPDRSRARPRRAGIARPRPSGADGAGTTRETPLHAPPGGPRARDRIGREPTTERRPSQPKASVCGNQAPPGGGDPRI